jgi:transcriptional regulator with XRE-family HTH domain
MIKTKSYMRASARRYNRLATLMYQARMARNVTQTTVAGELGAAQTQVSRVERGKDVPDVVEFLEWCRVLELDPVAVIKQVMEV